jgi:hypothetical protein
MLSLDVSICSYEKSFEETWKVIMENVANMGLISSAAPANGLSEIWAGLRLIVIKVNSDVFC